MRRWLELTPFIRKFSHRFVWKCSRNPKQARALLTTLGVLAVLNLAITLFASTYPLRLDLTRDQRYTPSAFFLRQMAQLETPLRVRLFLDGDLPPAWMALKSATRDWFVQYAQAGGHPMDVEWEPVSSLSAQAKQTLFNELQAKGGRPMLIRKPTKDGSLQQETVWPCALISYQGKEVLIHFIEQGQLQFSEQDLASTLQRYDFLLSNAMLTLTTKREKQIALVLGNGSLSAVQTRALADHLNQYYRVSYVQPRDSLGEWDRFAAVLLAKPTERFSEKRKYILDQYLMQGGAVAFFMDGAQIQDDLLAQGKDAVAMSLDVGLQDLLFHYGLRIQNNLIQDEQCAFIPVQSLRVQNSTQFEPAPWPYYPLFQGEQGSAIGEGLYSILGRFVSGIDTLFLPGIRKQVLLRTSPQARAIGLPGMLNLAEIGTLGEVRNQRFITGVLCEGRLSSAYKQRAIEALFGSEQNPDSAKASVDPLVGAVPAQERREVSKGSVRYALIGDGDLLRNEVSGGIPYPLGYDRFLQKEIYSNLSFVANLVHYLAGEHEWLALRSRKWEQALLDKQKVRSAYFSGVMLLGLAVLLWIFGIYWAVMGYRKYRFGTIRLNNEKNAS